MDITINIDPQVYADGTTMGAYPASRWLPGQFPSGAPLGTASDSADITSGAVTFDLDPGAYYVTKTTTPYSYVSLFVVAPDLTEVAIENAMGVVVHADSASVERPAAPSVFTWVGSVEPDNLGANDVWIDTSA